MGIVLKNIKMNNNHDIVLNSHNIIGIMGEDYQAFFKAFQGENIFYMPLLNEYSEETVYQELLKDYPNKDEFKETIKKLLGELEIKLDYLDLEIDNLSHGDKRLLDYLKMFLSDKAIMIIDEPFLYIDYACKKKICYYLKDLVKRFHKTIIMGSQHSEDIYLMTNYVLLISFNSCFYGKTFDVFQDKSLLDKYHIDDLDIVEFIRLSRKKNVCIDYTNDIRDLIKDVYKNVQ